MSGFVRGLLGLAKGMGITLTEFFAKTETVQYPESVMDAPRWRGIHGLFFTDDVKEELCVSCCLCARVCPAQAISMQGRETPDGDKKLVRFDVDLGRCVYCGFCEEVCPVEAIRLTPSWDYVSRDRAGLVLHKEDLLEIGRITTERGQKEKAE